MKRRCAYRHRGPFLRAAPNVTHCRACGDSWTHAVGAPMPDERQRLPLFAAMRRTFWVSLVAGFALWAALSLVAWLR